MAKQHDIFVQGCQTNSGIGKKEAEDIWNLFEPFQGYGFNKAHAACYGRVAYQTAYMKSHFPAEYMCAVLSAESGDTEKIAEIIIECQRMKIPVLAPEINHSLKDFTVIKGSENEMGQDQIRFGLLTIKNVGENVINSIINEKQRGGIFKNIDDFVTRIHDKDLNKKSLESLIKVGALDGFGERAALLASMDQLLYYSRESNKAQVTGQISLFGGPEAAVSLPPIRLAEAEPVARSEKLMWEKELLGLFITDHPLKDYQQQLNFEKGLIKIKGN